MRRRLELVQLSPHLTVGYVLCKSCIWNKAKIGPVVNSRNESANALKKCMPHCLIGFRKCHSFCIAHLAPRVLPGVCTVLGDTLSLVSYSPPMIFVGLALEGKGHQALRLSGGSPWTDSMALVHQPSAPKGLRSWSLLTYHLGTPLPLSTAPQPAVRRRDKIGYFATKQTPPIGSDPRELVEKGVRSAV